MRLNAAMLWFDKHILDTAIVGVGNFCRRMGIEFRRLQNGQVQIYGLVMVLGATLFILYFALGLVNLHQANQIKPNKSVVTTSAGRQVSSVTDSNR
jgi:hypothetical protein